MTKNKKMKRAVREYAKKHGLSYTAALTKILDEACCPQCHKPLPLNVPDCPNCSYTDNEV